MTQLSGLLEEFLEECEDILSDLEDALLILETQPHNRAQVDRVFRGFHTIKGGAGIVELGELGEYAHVVESLLEKLRDGKVASTPDIITLLLQATDVVKSHLQHVVGAGDIARELETQTLQAVGVFQAQDLAAPPPPQAPLEPSTALPEISGEANSVYLLHLRFHPDYLKQGGEPLLLLEELEQLGTTLAIAHPGAVPELDVLNPDTLHLWWSVQLLSERPLEDIQNVLMFFEQDNDFSVELVSGPPDETTEQTRIAQGDESSAPEPPPPAEAPQPLQESQKPEAPTGITHSIRVNVDRLDRLQNLVGETVINHARLHQIAEKLTDRDEELGELLHQFVEDHEFSIRELQDQILQVRMVPLEHLFTPMRRTIRDYAQRHRKQIRLSIKGADTEIDKSISEQLHGPLVHVVRNAMDHGIETPDERQQAGKPPEGQIQLNAYHQEGYVVVEIRDDGRGIDPEAILASASRKGLLTAGQRLDENEVLQLVFAPGFSTSTEVSEVSGRGVGMDTVKREIEGMLGTVQLESQVGTGTILRLRLPLTLAILEAMLVRLGPQTYTIPLLSVIESLQPRAEQVKHLKGRGELVEIRNEYLPLIRLHQRFQVEGATTNPAEALVVVVQHANRKSAILVDEILDQQPVVIKNLEDNFIQVSGLAGATILGQGEVSFILDIAQLT